MFSSEKFSDSSDIGLVSRSECAYIKIPPPSFQKNIPICFSSIISKNFKAFYRQKRTVHIGFEPTFCDTENIMV